MTDRHVFARPQRLAALGAAGIAALALAACGGPPTPPPARTPAKQLQQSGSGASAQLEPACGVLDPEEAYDALTIALARAGDGGA